MKWFSRRPKARKVDYGLAWCDCGAQVAADYKNRRWDCSDILLGQAPEKGQPGSMRHSDVFPFAFWSIKLDRSGKAPVRSEPRNQESQ